MAACSARAIALPLAVAVAAGGCEPDFDTRTSSVEGLRVLAVQAEPAEARPSAEVTYTALLVDRQGEPMKAPIDWAYCNRPKPLSDLNDVATECFVLKASYLAPLGTGPRVSGKIPVDACRLFGPNVPPSEAGQPPGRPADPDATGGYYQPLRLVLPNGGNYVLAAGESRLTCGLAGATTEVLQAFAKGYRPNQNPVLTAVSVVGANALAPDGMGAAPLTVARGQAVRLRASWPSCPAIAACGDGICGPGEDVTACPGDCTTPKGCGGAEPFVRYDPVTRALVQDQEAMVVSWFATGGAFEGDRSGPPSADAGFAENRWTAPGEGGESVLWVVLRDSRGGVTWQRYRIRVT